MHGEENLYTYTVAQRKTSLSIFTLTIHIYIYTTENVFLFCSSVASQWHSLWKYKYHASFCSFGSLITEKGKCYIYICTYGKYVFAFILTIYFIPICTPPPSRKIIFFSRGHEYSLSLSKKKRERKTILTISPIVLTHVSLNDWLIFLRSRLAETMCNETCERKVPLSAIIDS